MEKTLQASSLPDPYTFFRGGLYLGIFYPGPPVYPAGSEILGNEFTGKAVTYKTKAEGFGEKASLWAIVIAPTDISNFVMRIPSDTDSTADVSFYDGYFNKEQTTTFGLKTIDNYKRGGYTDWYIPSRDELGFIAKNLPIDFNLDERFLAMNKSQYLSSSYGVQNYDPKNSGKKINLLFAQSFSSSTYGDTVLVSDTKPTSVRLIRRVPVYII